MSLILLCRDFLRSICIRSDYDGGGAVQVYGSVRDPDRQSGNRGGTHRPHIYGKMNNHRH